MPNKRSPPGYIYGKLQPVDNHRLLTFRVKKQLECGINQGYDNARALLSGICSINAVWNKIRG